MDRKLDRALRSLIPGQLFLERIHAARCRIKADVIFKGCEMDQIPVQGKCGDLIIDRFLGGWCSFLDGLP